MNLPDAENLPINKLAACFNKTSATYKYYWLLSILQEVETGNLCVAKRNLFARMISNAWYTVNYFHVSFGKQDLIQEATGFLYKLENIPINAKLDAVLQKLVSSQNANTREQLWHFNGNVPHWFLSPWFPGKDKNAIYQASREFTEKCLYALYDDKIIVNPEWKDYLIRNVKVLKDFCYWNLSLFLQAKNPNVPDIPNKLIKPAERNSLTMQRRKCWDLVLNELGHVRCIYTGEKLTVDNYAVDHFIPYSFVSHDLIWNLIPAEKNFNTKKRDKLPAVDTYFSSFFELQQTAVHIMRQKTPKNKLLEDYLTIFPDLDSITSERFKERVQPLITIAANNGFEFLS